MTMSAGGAARRRWFAHMQLASRIHLDTRARQLVPAPQLRKRNTEAIGNGYQRVASPRNVEHHAR